MNRRERILEAVRAIPAGRVSTYGDVAAAAGLRGAAREVGWALAGLAEDDVPWWRVVNAAGRLSLPPPSCGEQARRLRAEGVEVSDAGRVELRRLRWTPEIDRGPE
jgi:methylated-DNA-protein-cysteine methyltransferase-like protein